MFIWQFCNALGFYLHCRERERERELGVLLSSIKSSQGKRHLTTCLLLHQLSSERYSRNNNLKDKHSIISCMATQCPRANSRNRTNTCTELVGYLLFSRYFRNPSRNQLQYYADLMRGRRRGFFFIGWDGGERPDYPRAWVFHDRDNSWSFYYYLISATCFPFSYVSFIRLDV